MYGTHGYKGSNYKNGGKGSPPDEKSLIRKAVSIITGITLAIFAAMFIFGSWYTLGEDAKQGMDTAINNANADANTRIPNANAQADKIIKDAQASKEARIAEAEGQVARFNSLYEEYNKFPLITKERMFYETMEKVLPSMDIYITDGDTETLLPLELFSTVNNTNTSNGGQ